MQEIYFQNPSGKKLAGILEMPHSDFCPLVVLCHGFGGEKSNPYISDIAEILKENNIASFRFDFNAHGQSEGDFETTGISKQAADLKSAFSEVMKMKKIDFSRLGLFGFSLGGTASLLVAPKLSLKCLALGAPVSSFREVEWEIFLQKKVAEWKKKGFVMVDGKKLSYHFFEDGLGQDVYSAAQKISCPTLIVHGEKDSIVPVKQSKKLFDSLKCEKKIEIIPEADHSGWKEDQYNHFLSITTKWFIQHLKA